MSAPARSPAARPRVALVGCAAPPEPDPDEDLLLAALGAAGLDARLVAWDAPRAEDASVAAFDLAVVRSTWNYPEHLAAFDAWLGRAAEATRLENPLAVLRGNVHKGYLRTLEAAGLPVVPTHVVGPGDDLDAAWAAASAAARARGSARVVVKPAVGCGSRGTLAFALARGRGDLGDEVAARAHLAALRAAGDAVLQPFVDAVEHEGERSVVCLDGEPSHVVAKRPRFHGGVERVEGPFEPTPHERALALRALATVAGPTLYARVDLFPTSRWETGDALISELELLEPSLFLRQSPPALARFVSLIARRAHDARR